MMKSPVGSKEDLQSPDSLVELPSTAGPILIHLYPILLAVQGLYMPRGHIGRRDSYSYTHRDPASLWKKLVLPSGKPTKNESEGRVSVSDSLSREEVSPRPLTHLPQCPGMGGYWNEALQVPELLSVCEHQKSSCVRRARGRKKTGDGRKKSGKIVHAIY